MCAESETNCGVPRCRTEGRERESEGSEQHRGRRCPARAPGKSSREMRRPAMTSNGLPRQRVPGPARGSRRHREDDPWSAKEPGRFVAPTAREQGNTAESCRDIRCRARSRAVVRLFRPGRRSGRSRGARGCGKTGRHGDCRNGLTCATLLCESCAGSAQTETGEEISMTETNAARDSDARRFLLPFNHGGQPRHHGGSTQGLRRPRRERSEVWHKDR